MNTATLAALALLVSVACTTPAAVTTSHSPTPDSAPASPQAATPAASRHLQAADSLPDPACSPGALNSDVTPDPAVLGRTICKTGWTAMVQPDAQESARLKREVLQRYSIPLTDTRLYELDHRVPLEEGGAPRDLTNLWPQRWEQDTQHRQGTAPPGTGAQSKDKIENRIKAAICNGRMSLQQGQQVFLGNWWQA
jgi:hypothetical protein